MFAARLWFLCRWIGHDAAAVLDGGFAAWKARGYPVTAAPVGAAARGLAHRSSAPGARRRRRLRARTSRAIRRCSCSTRARRTASPAKPNRSIRSAGTFPARGTAGSKKLHAGRHAQVAASSCARSSSAPASTPRAPCISAARASPRRSRSSRWSTPASRARASIMAPGASGSPIPRARSRPGR